MAHVWKPIEDLPDDWNHLVDQQAHSVVDLWKARASELRETSAYRDFLIKLRRQWAIETGVLERLYRPSAKAPLRL